MLKINPLELLQLQYQDLENIKPETIAQAKQRLLSNIDGDTISYGGKRVGVEKVEELVKELEEPRMLGFYHKVSQYPELNNFLAGDSYAIVEEEALQEAAITEIAAERLHITFAQLAGQALETGKPTVLAAFSKQIEKGSTAFQDAVFKKAGRDLLDGRLAELQQWADELEGNPSEEKLQQLRGLHLLREKVPIDSINALPQSYQPYRDAFARAMGRMVHALSDKDPALAIGIIRYARRIHCEEEYAERLNKAYKQLEQKISKSRSAAAAGSTQKWGVIGGIVMLLTILIMLAALLNWGYQSLTSFYYEPGLGEEFSLMEEAQADGLAAVQQALEDSSGLSRERLQEILSQSGGGTQLVEEEALSQLPWRERGNAMAEELSGEVEKGSAPLAVCFPPREGIGSQRSFTIVGDPVYDALLFIFNGRNYFHQAYIPAKTNYTVEGKISDEVMVSTMLAFGQSWDPTVASPCGTPGYFTDNIFYGGFAAYATEPPYLNLKRDELLILKKERLMPSRRMDEEEFFGLLEKYR